MTEAQAAKITAVPDALGMSYRMILDKEGRREIVFQTHVDQDVSTEKLNGLLDRLARAVERQMAIAEMVEARRGMETEIRQVATFEAALEQLDISSQMRWDEGLKNGSWNPDKLPPAERSARENTKLGIERSKGAVQYYRERIVELEGMVSGDGSAGTANRHLGVSNREVSAHDGAGGAKAERYFAGLMPEPRS